MRNKNNIQELVSRIETIQKSFINYIQNTPMSDTEKVFFEKQVETSKQQFEQIRTFLNQEDEQFNQQFKSTNYGINSGRF